MASRARLDISRHGTLVIRFHWRGEAFWEGLGVPDTPEHRAHFEPICQKISDALARDVFEERLYLSFFPGGNKAHRFAVDRTAAPAPLLRDYAEEWGERMRRERMRRGTLATYQSHLNRVKDLRLASGEVFGNLRVDEIVARRVQQCRTALLGVVNSGRAKAIMGGGLRRVIHAAIAEELLAADPFVNMGRWPRQESPPPDPFTREERDKIIGQFHSTIYGAFVFTLFHSGMRPGEAVALRQADVNLESGMCRITRSRVLGEENEPKTANSRRTIQLARAVVGELRRVPALPDPAAYLFPGPDGLPIDQSLFAKGEWRRALAALGIRPRKFYATRHTFLSVAVSLGRNFKWLAGYCGTSARMIDRHYAVYLPDAGGDQLAALATEAEMSQEHIAQLPRTARAPLDPAHFSRRRP